MILFPVLELSFALFLVMGNLEDQQSNVYAFYTCPHNFGIFTPLLVDLSSSKSL